MGKLSTIQKRENLNTVSRIGKEGPGGAYHGYDIYTDSIKGNAFCVGTIAFQCGPRNEEDSVHGVLDGDLLEIVRDRLTSFQAGPFSSRYNAIALTHIEEALMWMNRRVEDRIERNVLGTYKK